MNKKSLEQTENLADSKASPSNKLSIALLAQKHDDELITRAETAAWLAVCCHTIQRNRSLKPIRFNRRLVRYRVGDVRALIQAAGGK